MAVTFGGGGRHAEPRRPTLQVAPKRNVRHQDVGWAGSASRIGLAFSLYGKRSHQWRGTYSRRVTTMRSLSTRVVAGSLRSAPTPRRHRPDLRSQVRSAHHDRRGSAITTIEPDQNACSQPFRDRVGQQSLAAAQTDQHDPPRLLPGDECNSPADRGAIAVQGGHAQPAAVPNSATRSTVHASTLSRGSKREARGRRVRCSIAPQIESKYRVINPRPRCPAPDSRPRAPRRRGRRPHPIDRPRPAYGAIG